MNEKDMAANLKADLILRDLKRRDRLLKIVQGQSEWKVWTCAVASLAIVTALSWRTQDSMVPVVLALMVTGFAGDYVATSRRLSALIELLGEDRLLKTKDNKGDA